MRYFFHVRAAEGLIPDDEGTELAGLEQVKQEATINAHELAQEFPTGGNGVSLKCIEVVDELGHFTLCEPIYSSFPSPWPF